MKSGSAATASRVSRHSVRIMITRIAVTVTMLEAMVMKVPVMAF